VYWILVLLLLFGVSKGNATIFYVNPGSSITMSVEQATDGDTVILYEDVHEESVILYGKSIVLASLYLLDGDTSHIALTEIHGDELRPDSNSALIIAYGEADQTRIVGLTLSGEGGTNWEWGEVAHNGGGAYVFLSDVTFDHCCFNRASAENGGGLIVTGQPYYPESAGATIIDCLFTGCRALLSGGGLYARDCTLNVSRCAFVSDTALHGSGGIRVSRSHATVDSCGFTYCQSKYGALWFWTSTGEITSCLFQNNAGIAFGDVTDLDVSESDAPITGCRFQADNTQHHAIELWASAVPFRFEGNLVENLTAIGATGNLIVTDHSLGEIGYNIFCNNTNSEGGTITCVNRSHPRVHHNVFVSNVSLEPERPSVLMSVSQAYPSLDSNIIYGNYGPTIDWVLDDRVGMDARNNWWGDPSGPYHPTLNPSGQGDTLLSDSVLFIPWLTEPPDTTMPNDVREREHPAITRTWELAEVYPNPFNSSLQIVLAGFSGNDFEITLHNLLGQVVDVITRGPLTGGHFTYQAPLWLSSGVYFVKASDRQSLQTRKVVFLK
jgi:hypothetical protein